MSVLRVRRKLLKGGGGMRISGEGMLMGMLRGKALLFPSACLQGFCPRGADVQHLAPAWPLALAYLLGKVCESQAW